MPLMLMCRVRGIGVAERVKTSMFSLQIFYLFLMIDTEPLFLIDNQEPQILEFYVL